MDIAPSCSEASLADKLDSDEIIAIYSEYSATNPAAMNLAATDSVVLLDMENPITSAELISGDRPPLFDLLSGSLTASGTHAQISDLHGVSEVGEAESQAKATASTTGIRGTQRCAVDAGVRLAGRGAVHDFWAEDDQSSVRSVLPPPYAAYR